MQFWRSIPLFLTLLSFVSVPATAERLRVLLLDYNEPTEHDVLLSYLCVERCSASRGCPAELVRQGVDYYSEDFAVFRPQYVGQSARFVVEIYRQRDIDFVSLSGHHASGFSGDHGRGRFDTEKLASQMADTPGAEAFFTSPSLVMLHGCRTDVKSKFDGDPIEYVLHVIDETTVRDDDFARLLAAVQQIGGVQQAYRELFPNACLLGYTGTQTPGGRLEIYKQIDATFRGLESMASGKAKRTSKYDLEVAKAQQRNRVQVGKEVERECQRGWPCNLCRQDPGYYGSKAAALAEFLRRERQRIHQQSRRRGEASSLGLEQTLENAAFYRNTRWSCSTAQPGTAPVWPDPVDESPFGRLFLELLLLDLEGLDAFDRSALRAELVHRLGTIEFTPQHQVELRAWLHSEATWQRLQSFVTRDLLALSTFRQQSFFSFFSAINCGNCLRLGLEHGRPPLLRENAARQLNPELGAETYLLALSDPDHRVRRAAARRLRPGLGREVRQLALADPDAEVRRLASESLQAPRLVPQEDVARPTTVPPRTPEETGHSEADGD